ncbi:tudor domain-containing protein 15 [Brienomyrus brachyistius]|uniref:tudor domain-containing protein 15 n=1 Tax=Brienomyrus brachyistius TaxID=42636 RepID=UPI0020B1C426|nr:tudor domain-containing protein 15 [Brienomyrus brachyistius]XP_048841493.1 tudor domain-containing protein 15 [Brienomyrus brachyistius]
MLSNIDPGAQRPQGDSNPPTFHSLATVDLLLTHVDCSPVETLVQFQGQYLTICELDYDILQKDIQSTEKTKAWLDIGELCLVKDVASSHWYRGQVRCKRNDLFEVFLLDYGSVLAVSSECLVSASEELFALPPKIVCGFFANILPLGEHWNVLASKYFCSLIGTEIKGHIQALLSHKVVILEVVDVNMDLFRLNLGRHVDVETFFFLVGMLTEVPVRQRCGCAEILLTEKPNSQKFLRTSSGVQEIENLMLFFGPQLTVGKKEKIRITAAVNSKTFYCQLESMVNDLKEMSEKLSSFCDSKSKGLCDKGLGNLGLLCAVKGKDDKWHRGIVQFLPVNSQVRVLFVDYGFCESVRVEHICQLPPSFLSIPIMAFHCTLSCLSETDENVLKEQLEHIKMGLLGGILDIQVDSFDTDENLYSVTLNSVKADAENGELQENGSHPSRLVRDSDFCKMGKISSVVKHTNEKVMEYSEDVDWLKDIKDNSIFRGFVEYVLNPSDFWLRTEERNCRFEAMLHNMAEYFNDLKLHEGILENPLPGTLCCAMYEKDMQYYRAVVREIIENGAEVFFIDFGNTERVPYMFIKKLPPEFAGEPKFAINCSLAHVVSVEDVWTTQATNYFKQAVCNRALLVHVVQKKNDRLDVELYEKEASESINMLIARAKMAVFWKSKAKKLQSGKFAKCQGPNKTSPAKEIGNKDRNSSSKSLDLRYQNKETRVEKNTLATKELMQNIMVRQIPKQDTSVKKISFKEQILKVGTELSVRCCHFNSSSDFWCQPQSKLKNLDRLMAKIQSYYQENADAFQLNEECCVAKHQEDGKWYRGLILRTQYNEFDVLLVDFGMTIRQKTHNLRAIKQEFLELEMQAFRCSVYPLLEPAGEHDVWSTDADKELKTFVQSTSLNLKCTVHSTMVVNGLLFSVVDIHTPLQSATKLLMEKGLAKPVHHPKLFPSVDLSSYMFSMFDMKIGDSETVYVTHVCSPWQLYFQLDRNGKMLEDLMEVVTKQSNEIPSETSGLDLAKLCLAKYIMDDKWYRGLAFPVQSNQHLNVLFVDYGNMHIVEKKNVRPIPRHATDLVFIPMQAMRCSLAHVPKGEALAKVNTWLENAALNKLLKATFVEREDDGTLICELFDGNLHLNEKVRELMVTDKQKEETLIKKDIIHSEKPSVGIEQPKARSNIKKSLKVNLDKTAARCNSKHLLHRVKSQQNPPITKASTWHMSNHKVKRDSSAPLNKTDSSAIETRQYKAVSRPLRQKSCTFKLPKLAQLPETKIKPGFREVGYISHVSTVTDFHIQMENEERTILRLAEDLNSSLFRDQTERITGNVNIGDLIAAEYKKDGALYRAVVKDVTENQMKVEFIDYGNTAVVQNNNVFRLSNTFLLHPRLSIPCSTKEPLSFGKEILTVSGKPFMVEFVKQCELWWMVNLESAKEGILPAQKLSLQKCKDEEEVFCDLSAEDKQPVGECAAAEDKQIWYPSRDGQGVKIPTVMCDNVIRKNPTLTESKKNTIVNCAVVWSKRRQLLMSSKHGAPIERQVKKCCKKKQSAKCISQGVSKTSDIKKATIPPDPKIIPGQVEDGTLLSVLENGDFYIRLHQNSRDFTLLCHLLQKEAFKCDLVPAIETREGLECLAKLTKTNQWYRAVVQNTYQGKCSVFLLDHGISEVVSVQEIRELCEGLRQIPVQAILCRWNVPAKATAEADEDVKHQLKDMIERDIKIKLVSYSAVSKLWTVEVMINEMYLRKQHSKVKESLEILPKELSMKEENTKERHQAPRLSLAPVKTDVGYLGLAVAVATPCGFYIILNDLLLAMSMVSAAVDDLPDDLVSLPESFLIPGACCLVRSETQKKWCRSEIVHMDSKSVVVNLVDYGHCAVVPYVHRHDIKWLPEKLTAIPKVTHPCVLRAVRPSGEDHWSDEAVVCFQELMSKGSLMIYFRQLVSEMQWEVDILSQGVNVAKALVNAGYATYIDGLLSLRVLEEPVATRASLEKCTTMGVDKTPELNPEDTFFHNTLDSHQQLQDLGTVSQHVDLTAETENQKFVEEWQDQVGTDEDCSHQRTEAFASIGASQEVRKCVQM